MMMQLADLVDQITILDHHKTAAEDITELLDLGIIEGEFDMTRSGAVMAWDFFHSGRPVPTFLKMIQDRDLWQFQIEGTKELHAYLMLLEKSFTQWNELENLKGLYDAIEYGELILNKNEKDMKWILDQCKRIVSFDEWAIPVANVPPYLASDAGHSMNENTPFSMTYFDYNDKRVFSLRSRGNFDVSAIAKKHGGGGHKNAAGFTVEFPLAEEYRLGA